MTLFCTTQRTDLYKRSFAFIVCAQSFIHYMGKIRAAVLGVLSAWPVLYYGYFSQVVLPSIVQSEDIVATTKAYLPLHLLTFLLCFFLFIYYLIKVLANKELGEEKKWWILGTIFLNGLVWPVYWYLHIWKKTK